MLSEAFRAQESIYTTFECTALTYLQSHLVRLPISIGEQREKGSEAIPVCITSCSITWAL